MENVGRNPSHYGLENQGLRNLKVANWNLPTASLYEHIIRRNEAVMAHQGPLVMRTGVHTGRSPNDKFLVREPSSEQNIGWGDVSRPIDAEKFDRLRGRLLSHLEDKEVFVQDCFAGADPEHRLPVRVITELAWHSLFAHNLFLRPAAEQLAEHVPEFTIISAPGVEADPETDGTRSGTFVTVNFGKKLVLIGGTAYAGEIKKSVFTILNYLLPLKSVLSRHCSANIGEKGDVALFFGLSGTGKTTLSTDPERRMIGDDEHGGTERGVFNFEGGCYAKVIRLSPEGEPQIYTCTHKFGTVLENVVIDSATRRIDLDDDSLTENTAHRPTFTRAGGLPLPGRLHGQGGRHRARHHRAQDHLQPLLRGSLHGAAPERLRQDAGGENRSTQDRLLAGEHRLDGRALRGGQPHEAGLHASNDSGCPQRLAGGRPHGNRSHLRPEGPHAVPRRPG
jgi:phosphoenolpyruvate carboxykinase (ATP)